MCSNQFIITADSKAPIAYEMSLTFHICCSICVVDILLLLLLFIVVVVVEFHRSKNVLCQIA